MIKWFDKMDNLWSLHERIARIGRLQFQHDPLRERERELKEQRVPKVGWYVLMLEDRGHSLMTIWRRWRLTGVRILFNMAIQKNGSGGNFERPHRWKPRVTKWQQSSSEEKTTMSPRTWRRSMKSSCSLSIRCLLKCDLTIWPPTYSWLLATRVFYWKQSFMHFLGFFGSYCSFIFKARWKQQAIKWSEWFYS